MNDLVLRAFTDGEGGIATALVTAAWVEAVGAHGHGAGTDFAIGRTTELVG